MTADQPRAPSERESGSEGWWDTLQVLRTAPRRTLRERASLYSACREILFAEPRPDEAVLQAALSLINRPLTVEVCRLLLDLLTDDAKVELRAQLVSAANTSWVQALTTEPALADFVQFTKGARTVSIVGNGPSLKRAGRGQEIDAADLVVRCNFPPIRDYAADVGTRTDVVVSFINPASDKFRSYFLNHTDYVNSWFIQMSSNFNRDYGPATTEVLEKWNLKHYARVPRDTIEVIEEISYREPTTGFHAIILFCVFLGMEVRLFGFDFFQSNLHHYWRNRNSKPAEVHDPLFERLHVLQCLSPMFGLKA